MIGSIAESPSMNRYAYVQGNPISLVDPFGLCPMVDWRGMGHFVLGALSLLTLIPTPATMAIGAIAAIANAAWYFHDGQTFEGICSLLCVLPVFGPTIGQIGMVTIGFMNIGKMNYDNWNRYVIGDEIYTWDQAKQDLLTGTLSIASIYGGAKGLGWDEVCIGKNSMDVPVSGSLTLMDGEDLFVKYSNRRADIDPDGYFDIVAHGDENHIYIGTPQPGKQYVRMGPAKTAEMLEKIPSYTKGQNVRLLSCNTGSSEYGFAQQLANRLGVTVKAPNNYLWVSKNGRLDVYGLKIRNQTWMPDKSIVGRFVEFNPDSSKMWR